MLLQSIPDWCFYDASYDPAWYYRTLKSLGVAGVEMVDPARMAAAVAAGLKILNLAAPGKERGLSDPANHAELLPQIRAAIALAQAHHIPHVIVFSGNRNGLTDAAGIPPVVAGLRAVAEDARRAGVTLAFEMFNTFDHPGYLADSSAFGFEVVRQVASPAVKVLFDIYHMHRMGENIAATLLAGLPHVCHIHVAGSPARDSPLAGQLDYRPLLRAVHAAGYRGYWGQEFVPGKDPMKELAAAIGRFAEWAAE